MVNSLRFYRKLPAEIRLKNKDYARFNIIFGQEATQKFLNNQQLSQEHILESKKTYEFYSEEEANAFKKGIEAAVGWEEVYVLEENIEFGIATNLVVTHD